MAGPGQVQVRVTAVGLNHIDLFLRQGMPALHVELPHVSGGDVCGQVAALGDGVTGVAVGDRVLVNPGLSCGHCQACLSGRDNFCPEGKLLGEHCWGGCAELVVVPRANLVPVPRATVPLDDTALAAVPIAFITAWQMLVERAVVRPGETVQVLAAGTGVGTSAIQIAKLFGACHHDRVDRREAGAARALGADEVINYRTSEMVAEERLTGRRGADVVVEHVGAATFPKSVVAAARGGRIKPPAVPPMGSSRCSTCDTSSGASSRSWARRWRRRHACSRSCR